MLQGDLYCNPIITQRRSTIWQTQAHRNDKIWTKERLKFDTEYREISGSGNTEGTTPAKRIRVLERGSWYETQESKEARRTETLNKARK